MSYHFAHGQRATYLPASYVAISNLAPFEYKAMEMTYPKKCGLLPLCATTYF